MANKKKKDKFIAAAQKHAQKQNFDKAIKEYKKALDEDKKDARVALKLGELHGKIKKPQDGIKYFRVAASSYSKDGFYPKAIAVYKQILGIDDGQYDVRLEIADLYQKLGLMSDAIGQFKQALAYFEKEGDQEKTVDIVRKMVDIDPQNISNRVKLAEHYFKTGKRDQGYVEFKRAAEDLKSTNKWDELIKLYATMTKADPTNADNYRGYGDALMEKGDLDKAFQAYHQILKYAPDDIDAMEKVIKVSVRLQDTQNAVQILKKLALIYDKQGNADKCNTCWQRILKLHPGDEEAMAQLGEQPDTRAEKAVPIPRSISTSAEDKEEKKAEPLDPADDEDEVKKEVSAPEPDAEIVPPSVSEQNLEPPASDAVPGMLTEADVYLKYGLIDKAQNYIARILAGFPDNHEALRMEALIHKENGQIDLAVQGLLKAAKTAGQQNSPDDARMYAEEVLAIEPSNTQAQSFMAELGSGEEVSLEIEDDAIAAAVEPDVLTIEEEEPELVLETEKPVADTPEAPEALDEAEPFDFVEEAGDDRLLLIDEDDPGVQDEAPDKPMLKLEGETQEAAPEPDSLELEVEGEEEIEEVSFSKEVAPEPEPEPATPPPAFDISAEMEEAEFLEQQGLIKEAKCLYEKILNTDPEYTPAKEKLETLDQKETPAESTMPIFEEIEDEDEEVEVEEIPSIEGVVDAAQEALSDTFKEEIREDELEIPADALEEAPPEPEPVAAKASGVDLDDEWGDGDEEEVSEEVAREGETEGVSAASNLLSDIDGIADASDDAWDDVLKPEDEEPAERLTAAEAHPEIGEIADAAEEAFGAAFGEEGEFDLSGVLDEWDEDEAEEPAAREAPISDVDDVSLIIQSFSERVHDQIGEDATAHFDLGIAYKEMAILDEAIGSFRTALKSGANPSECLNMIGLCFMDKGEYTKAEGVFREGLKQENIREQDCLTLKYELGVVLEEQKRFGEALDLFREVADINPHFRDIGKIIIRVEERLGGPDDGDPDAPPSPRDKISYI